MVIDAHWFQTPHVWGEGNGGSSALPPTAGFRPHACGERVWNGKSKDDHIFFRPHACGERQAPSGHGPRGAVSDPTRVGSVHELARYTSPLFIIDQGQLTTTTYSLITGALAPDPTRVGRGL